MRADKVYSNLYSDKSSKFKMISNYRNMMYDFLKERGSIELGCKEPRYWSEIFFVDFILEKRKILYFFKSKRSIKKELAFITSLIEQTKNYTVIKAPETYRSYKKDFMLNFSK